MGVVVPNPMVNTRTPRTAAASAGLRRFDALGVRAVGQHDDHVSRVARPLGRFGIDPGGGHGRVDRGDSVDRGEDRRADRRTAGRGEVVDRLDQRVGVGGRRHLQPGDAGEGDQADPGAAVLGLDEGDRRLLGDREPVGFHIGGAHGPRHVHRQHDRRGVRRHRHARLRPGRPDAQRGEAEHQQQASGSAGSTAYARAARPGPGRSRSPAPPRAVGAAAATR